MLKIKAFLYHWHLILGFKLKIIEAFVTASSLPPYVLKPSPQRPQAQKLPDVDESSGIGMLSDNGLSDVSKINLLVTMLQDNILFHATKVGSQARHHALITF